MATCPECGGGLSAHRYVVGYELHEVEELTGDTARIDIAKKPIESQIEGTGAVGIFCRSGCGWNRTIPSRNLEW